MYWDDQGIFVGKETPERMFVGWTILSRIGLEDHPFQGDVMC